MTDKAPSASPRFPSRLQRTRLTTRIAMMFERAWPLALPLLVVASLFLTFAWGGGFRLLPETGRLAVAALFGLAGLAALIPLGRYRQPKDSEIDARIEAANGLVHAPLVTQTDMPVGPADSFSAALWREHQKRMAARLASLHSDLPRTRVPERDPYALRAVPALALVAAFAFSFGPYGGSVLDAFRAPPLPEAVPPRIDAWVTPPTYTGKAPVFLTAEGNAQSPLFTVPAGSAVSVRVTGGAGSETLDYATADGTVALGPPADAVAPAAAASAGSLQFAGTLGEDGVLTLRAGEREIDSWRFAVTPDRAPEIRFVEEPKSAVNGSLELQYEILDDYGAASAKSDFALADEPAAGARPLYPAPEMPLSVPRRGGRDVTQKATRDLTEHVWAGSTVKLTLSAVDDSGQEARSETKTFRMPEKPFSNPLARAIVEWRRIFSLDANRKAEVLALIDAVTMRPDDTISNASHYLGIMAGRSRLKLASTDEALRDTADYFWQMALQVEDGNLSDAERRLRQAQEALKQALRDGASDQEIDRLMQELRQAMNEFLREFAERAARDPNMAQQQPNQGQEMRQSDLERMMDQIENLAKSGNREQAEQLLSELQNMMNNLQAGRQQQQGQNGQQSEMRQQMDKLGEIMRRQQETMNETFRMDQMQRGQQGQEGQQGEQGEQGEQFGQGQQEGEQQQGGGMTPEEFAEAMKQLQEGQGQLQKELEGLMKGLEGMGIQPGEGFGEAGEAMGQAEGALGDQEGDRAVGEQGRALEALRKGAQDMMQQMQQAMQGDQGGGQEGGRQQNADRDPLGRPRATTGPDFGDSVKVPDEIDVQRARQILEAIRKRLGNALSPDLERSYLERLLEMR